MTKRMMVTMPDHVAAVIEGAAAASGQTGEVPTLSQAAICRLLLGDATDRLLKEDLAVPEDVAQEIDPEALSEIIPDHRRAKYLREEVKDESWLVDMREGFEGRVRTELEKRVRNGYDPEGLREFAQTFTREAAIYWQRLKEDDERYNEAVAFVEEAIEEATEKAEHVDPGEQWLADLKEGDEQDAEQDEEERESVSLPDNLNVEQAIQSAMIGLREGKSAPGQVTRLQESPIYAVDMEEAIEIVERAQDRLESETDTTTATEAPADD